MGVSNFGFLSETSIIDKHDCRDYWILGLSPSSGILMNTTFQLLDLFPSSGEGVEDT
jgi:hypothetical protein